MLVFNLLVMDIILKRLDRILSKDSGPLHKDELKDYHYKPLFENQKEKTTNFPLLFEYDIIDPFNYKTKYFDQVIRNEISQVLLHLVSQINKNSQGEPCWDTLRPRLTKCLHTRMKEIRRLTTYYGYSPEILDYDSPVFQKFKEHAGNTFIVCLVKYGYMGIYLEAQEVFSGPTEKKLTPEELFWQMDEEPVRKAPIHRIPAPPEGSSGLNGKERKGKTKKTKDQVSTDSFTYLGYKSAPEKLVDAFNSLKNSGLIAEETTKTDFDKIFSGGVIKNPVRWTGYTSDLYYFITQLHSKEKLILPLGKEIWAVTCKCFVRKDGTRFKRGSFRQLHHPITHKASIDMAVKHLV